MTKHTTKSILRAWRNLLAKGDKNAKQSIIKDIFKNDYELYSIVKRQIYLLEKYEEDFKDYMPVDDYIKGYEEMLSLLGLTSDTFNNEWDDETDRKS